MLSEEEKLKIRDEELFRHGLKAKLENSNKKSSLIQFFNTNFGLFILSTILIGSVNFSYNSHTDREGEFKEKKRLENELIHRFQTLQLVNDTMFWYQTIDIHIAFNGNASVSGLKPKYYNFKSLYQEYSNLSVIRIAENILEIQESSKLDSLVQLLAKNQETINHLRENWFLRLRSGKNLPKKIGIKTSTKRVNGRRIKYNYYLLNGIEVIVTDSPNQITKLAKIEANLDLKSLVTLMVNYNN